MDFSYASNQKVIFFTIGGCSSADVQNRKWFGRCSHILNGSQCPPERVLYSVQAGVYYNSLNHSYFTLLSLWNNQKFKFVDKMASQCVCAQPVRPWSLQLPLGAEPLYLQVPHSSQRVPGLTEWDGDTRRRLLFWFPQFLLFPQNTPLPVPAVMGTPAILCASAGPARQGLSLRHGGISALRAAKTPNEENPRRAS